MTWAAPMDKLKGPWESPKPAAPKTEVSASTPAWLFHGAIRFFQIYISPADGARCSMYPTCSEYGRQAVAKHGAFLGFIMSADRLMRDNAGAWDYYPTIIKYGHERLYDPVEDNDFWF